MPMSKKKISTKKSYGSGMKGKGKKR